MLGTTSFTLCDARVGDKSDSVHGAERTSRSTTTTTLIFRVANMSSRTLCALGSNGVAQ
jgi:hypothetical protein